MENAIKHIYDNSNVVVASDSSCCSYAVNEVLYIYKFKKDGTYECAFVVMLSV